MQNSPPFLLTEAMPPHRSNMIYSVFVNLKDIYEQGKDYPWERPGACLRCNHYKVWGHGFVERFFHGFAFSLYLRCYRCPNCGCVISLRPDTHFRRVRTGKEEICSHLLHRLTHGRWPPSNLPRSRLRHWLANLKRQTLAYLTNTWEAGLSAAFERLTAMGLVPVSRTN